MGEKDIAEKKLLTYPDIFANILNVSLFHGDEVIRPEELTDILPQSTYKAEGKLREQDRDIAKLWKDNELHLALLGLENQSAIDKTMPLRIMGYDGAAYRDELNAESVNMHPVLTVVLYFGWERRWKKPLRLKDCFEIPWRLEPFVSDYRINVIEIAWLPDELIAQFANPFKQVAEYFSQMRKGEDYQPSDEYVRHAKEMLDLMSLLTKDVRFKELKDDLREGELMTMKSILLDKIEAKGLARGLLQGHEEGEAEGRAASARSLMETLHCTKEKAMELLKVPACTKEKAMELLKVPAELQPKILALL